MIRCRVRAFLLLVAFLVSFVATGATNLAWNVGADERIRHEIVNNLPRGGRSGRGTAKSTNWLRFRTRVWGEIESPYLRLYLRGANEFRWYPTGSGPGGSDRNWRFPDEFYIDNVYLDMKNVVDWLELRVGRQDFLGPEAYGAGRVIGDGTSGDDSRSNYFDAIRARVAFCDTEKLDILAIWNAEDYTLNWGDHGGVDRKPNTIVQGSTGLTEAGGGLYHRSRTLTWLPADFYGIYKYESAAWLGDTCFHGRDFVTIGTRLLPKFGPNLSGEFEVAVQSGRKRNGPYVGGQMAYAALEWDFFPRESFDVWTRASCYYMSGDRDPYNQDGDDYSWNPVWGRWPQFSDLWVKTFFYGIAYWSNLIYPAAEAGMRWEEYGTLKSAMGPLMAAVDDGVGHGDGGVMIGWLSSVFLEIPLFDDLWNGRGAAKSHIRCELLNPTGDYTESCKPACYCRWDVTLMF